MKSLQLFETIKRGDVGMGEPRENLRLAMKPSQPLVIFGPRQRQNFQSDIAIEFLIASQVDNAHPARSKLTDDAKRTEFHLRCESGRGFVKSGCYSILVVGESRRIAFTSQCFVVGPSMIKLQPDQLIDGRSPSTLIADACVVVFDLNVLIRPKRGFELIAQLIDLMLVFDCELIEFDGGIGVHCWLRYTSPNCVHQSDRVLISLRATVRGLTPSSSVISQSGLPISLSCAIFLSVGSSCSNMLVTSSRNSASSCGPGSAMARFRSSSVGNHESP